MARFIMALEETSSLRIIELQLADPCCKQIMVLRLISLRFSKNSSSTFDLTLIRNGVQQKIVQDQQVGSTGVSARQKYERKATHQ